MITPIFAELTVGADTYRFEGFQPPDPSASTPFMMITSDGIEGWYGTPDAKVSMTERGQGDGANDVAEMDVMYSARTVTLHCAAVAHDRGDQLDQLCQVLTSAHRIIRLRIRDEEQDTYVQGYATVTVSAGHQYRKIPFDLTVVCPRPERLSMTPHMIQLMCSTLDGGLSYGSGMATWWEGEPNNSVSVLEAPSLKGDYGLYYPLRYQLDEGVEYTNTGYLTNNGSSRAYPIIEVTGPFTNGVSLTFPDLGLMLATDMSLQRGEQLTFDSRSRTMQIGGVDASYALTYRGFPEIPPRSSARVALTSIGDGYVNCRVRDTYM